VFRPTSTGSAIVILTSLAASAALAVSAAISSWRRRRLARRMTAEGDQRVEALFHEQANSVTRKDLLEWRTLELQNSLDMLSAKRDELLTEIAAMQSRTSGTGANARTQRDANGAPQDTATPTLVAVPDIDEDKAPKPEQVATDGHPSRGAGTTI
ncbi:MAG: hypothetical protein QOI81_7, partial [Actinomycetota bacterium]|nr:hypothetical protein [Actinomycetota bacterium]